MSQVSILWDDSRSVFSILRGRTSLLLRSRCFETLDIPTMKDMVTQFGKELSESKSQGIDEEVRLYDVNASPASPDPSFLSAYPIRYDDCTD